MTKIYVVVFKYFDYSQVIGCAYDSEKAERIIEESRRIHDKWSARAYRNKYIIEVIEITE